MGISKIDSGNPSAEKPKLSALWNFTHASTAGFRSRPMSVWSRSSYLMVSPFAAIRATSIVLFIVLFIVYIFIRLSMFIG